MVRGACKPGVRLALWSTIVWTSLVCSEGTGTLSRWDESGKMEVVNPKQEERTRHRTQAILSRAPVPCNPMRGGPRLVSAPALFELYSE